MSFSSAILVTVIQKIIILLNKEHESNVSPTKGRVLALKSATINQNYLIGLGFLSNIQAAGMSLTSVVSFIELSIIYLAAFNHLA